MRDAVAGCALILLIAMTFYLGRRTDSPKESRSQSIKAITRGFLRFVRTGIIAFTRKFLTHVLNIIVFVFKLLSAENISGAFKFAFQLVVILVGGAIGLASLAFFGYGAFRGVVMFLTLEPVSILAGFVLCLVSLFVGYCSVVGCIAGTIYLSSAISADRRPGKVEP